MTARWVAFLTWAAVAAAAAYWILRLAASPTPLPAHAHVAAAGARPSADLQRVLGAGAPPSAAPADPVAAAPAPDPRFTLVGVVAPRPGTSAREGLALIAADDQPAKAFRVGSVVDGTLVLQAVTPRGASLGPRGGPPSVVLELPEMPAPATGQPPGGDAAPAAPPAPVARAPVPGLPPGLQPGRPNLPVPPVVPPMPPGQAGGQGDPEPRAGQAGASPPRTP
jgi:general secretion pathway protein C